jgi:hypothetical protein
MPTKQLAGIAIATLLATSGLSFGTDRIDEAPMPTNGAEIRLECDMILHERITQENFANPRPPMGPDYRIKVYPAPPTPPTKMQAESNLRRLEKRSADVGCTKFRQCINKCRQQTSDQLTRPSYVYCEDTCGRETLSSRPKSMTK